MPLHGNSGVHDGLDDVRPCALELENIAAAFLHHAVRGVNRLLHALVVRPENHIADDHRRRRALHDRADMVDHLVRRQGDGSRIAEDDHRKGIADENDVDSGLLHQDCRGVIVRGHHGDAFFFLFHFLQFLDRHFGHVVHTTPFGLRYGCHHGRGAAAAIPRRFEERPCRVLFLKGIRRQTR